jgi:hypothetical protein
LPAHPDQGIHHLQTNMNLLGVEGVDRYALKKTICSGRPGCLISTTELNTKLPKRAYDSIHINTNIFREISDINKSKEKPFQMVTRLIEAEIRLLTPELNLDDLTEAHAMRLCECFALLDNYHAQEKRNLSIDVINEYKKELVMSSLDELDICHAKLNTLLNDSSKNGQFLTDTFKEHKINYQKTILDSETEASPSDLVASRENSHTENNDDSYDLS